MKPKLSHLTRTRIIVAIVSFLIIAQFLISIEQLKKYSITMLPDTKFTESLPLSTPDNVLENNNSRDSSTNDDSFSACVLWMDDNHRLDEWLAYHYYLLKLRYVVINIDPWSRTPWSRSKLLEIVDRWNDHENHYNLGMTIVTMTDSDYKGDYNKWMERLEREEKSNSTDYGRSKTLYHRERQPEFYRHCSLHLMQQNRSWTSFHDNDEFLTFQPTDESAQTKMQQPGYILDRLNAIKQKNPPPDETTPFSPETQLSCLVVYRKKHCAKELSKEEVNELFLPSSGDIKDAVIPDGFMSSSISGSSNEYDDRESIVRRFDTIRYKYLVPGYDSKLSTNQEKIKFGNPKSFIDLSQSHVKQYVETHSYSKEFWDVHLVMKSLCKEEEKRRLPEVKDDLGKERFIVSHFLGSLESYSFRKDARQGGLRNYETWLEQSEVTDGEVMIAMQQWLKGFVELVGGTDVASYLLQDAGKFPYYFDVESRIDEMHQTYDFNDPSKTFPDAVYDSSQPCALLFFGIIKDDFHGLILPSIRTNIIDHNPGCDIFLHTYNLTHVPFNPRSGETASTETNITQAYDLTPHVKVDSMEVFETQRSSILNHTREHHNKIYGCCETHDNVFKQWHSIQGVWDLMQEHEAEILQDSDISNDNHYYKRVGLFRSDVFYTDPIFINNMREVAAIADFGHWGGYNDRMFYGTYSNAAVWASGRFNFTSTFEKEYMTFGERHDGYHSESFVFSLLNHHGIEPTMKSICLWRVRSGGKLKSDDCSPNGEGGEDVIKKRLEESGYEVEVLTGLNLDDGGKVLWQTQKKELSDSSSSSTSE